MITKKVRRRPRVAQGEKRPPVLERKNKCAWCGFQSKERYCSRQCMEQRREYYAFIGEDNGDKQNDTFDGRRAYQPAHPVLP